MKYGSSTILAAISCAMAFLAIDCGSSGGRNAPPVPNANIGFVSFLVDIGERFELNATNSTNPESDPLTFFWTKIHPTSETEFDDHCEEEPETVCFSNDDDVCRNRDGADEVVFCASNDDCVIGDDDLCILNSGTSSPDCTVGICLLGQSREGSWPASSPIVPGLTRYVCWPRPAATEPTSNRRPSARIHRC